MVGDFAVRVDLDTRRLSVMCSACRDAFVVDLTEPGFTRMLSMFASNHCHSGERPAPLSVVAD